MIKIGNFYRTLCQVHNPLFCDPGETPQSGLKTRCCYLFIGYYDYQYLNHTGKYDYQYLSKNV